MQCSLLCAAVSTRISYGILAGPPSDASLLHAMCSAAVTESLAFHTLLITRLHVLVRFHGCSLYTQYGIEIRLHFTGALYGISFSFLVHVLSWNKLRSSRSSWSCSGVPRLMLAKWKVKWNSVFRSLRYQVTDTAIVCLMPGVSRLECD
eukprot:6014042-Amphidinium_carterae.1